MSATVTSSSSSLIVNFGRLRIVNDESTRAEYASDDRIAVSDEALYRRYDAAIERAALSVDDRVRRDDASRFADDDDDAIVRSDGALAHVVAPFDVRLQVLWRRRRRAIGTATTDGDARVRVGGALPHMQLVLAAEQASAWCMGVLQST
jgi:hypothetical protein